MSGLRSRPFGPALRPLRICRLSGTAAGESAVVNSVRERGRAGQGCLWLRKAVSCCALGRWSGNSTSPSLARPTRPPGHPGRHRHGRAGPRSRRGGA
ncbi:Hypothetical protein SCLAV_p0459 (plasmid) [Streptomyces clavuligerus]|uniref:Uncharacterized protein n=1 Tax=Streptomyces clavuligerus TaxID=1901 RepID=D5SJ56_STRCL|nr:Hypothetical protein SCLAV_p0459 [Streptomyces clavuligerus]